jgi:hypothetical protein
MTELTRAVQAFRTPHTRRALLFGFPLFAAALAAGAALGSRDWLLLRATTLWLVGMCVVVQWRVAPLLRLLRAQRRRGALAGLGRHPVGALLLGILALAPLAGLGAWLGAYGEAQAIPAAQWQIAALEAVLLGGLTGLSVWEATVGRATRRRAEASSRRAP